MRILDTLGTLLLALMVVVFGFVVLIAPWLPPETFSLISGPCIAVACAIVFALLAVGIVESVVRRRPSGRWPLPGRDFWRPHDE
jgi:hypothetical protein